jgi:hypothetical protein
MVSHSRALSLVILSLCAIASSTSAQQPPTTAGSTRPNLRVLEALPEAQLFPVMNLLADSLGVRCEYCHVQTNPDLSRTPSNVGGWVWASDDKPQKRKARDMVRMVIDLNAGRFGGESRVTCYTCHRGATQPDRLPPQPPRGDLLRAPAVLPLPSGDRLWTTYVNAVGQADTPAGATIIKGWDDRPEGRYGKFEIAVAPDRYRITLSTPEGTTTQGLDAEGAWVAANDRVQRIAAPADVARMRRIAMRYRAVKERPSAMTGVGVGRLADRDVFVATARIDAITTRTLYFDVVTGLLRRDVTTTETLLLPLEEQIEYDDYRDVTGVQMPFRIRISDGATYSTTTRTISEIRRGVAADEALFRPPIR